MNENDLDQFFRDKLLKHSSPVPRDMWKRIQQKKGKDRRGFFFTWSLVVLLLIFLIGGYFILHTHEHSGNKKAISSANKKNIETQNDSNDLVKNGAKNEVVKTRADTAQAGQPGTAIVSNKQLANNGKIIYSNKDQHKESKPGKYFSSENTASGRYILKQKERPSKNNRTTQPVKYSINSRIKNGSDSSINNSRADENIARKDRDSAINAPANKVTPLPEDSLSKKAKPASENKSKKENEVSSLKKKWFLEVYGSPDIPFNEVTSGSAGTTDFIKKNFKTHLSYTLGLGIARSIDKHFSVQTGFQYSKIIAKMIDSNGVGIANHYRSIDVPFLIGYKMKSNGFSTTINAGIIFNLYSWYRGNSIATYKNYAGVSLYAGLNFAKQINKKIELFAEPHFRYRLSYMTRTQAPFNQKIHIAGVSFGLKYNF